MSQVVSPPSEPQPDTSAATALIAQELPPPPPASLKHLYEYQPPRQSAFWRVIKWPLRKFFKGLIVTGMAAKRHKIVALVVLALLVAAVGGTYAVYNATHPGQTALGQGQQGGVALPETPFTITSAPQPSLPSGVINALHGLKTHDAHEFWTSFSPQFRRILAANGSDEAAWRDVFARQRANGVQYQQFIYTGGYLELDGTSYYTFQVIEQEGNQTGQVTLYFAVNTEGQITLFQQLAQEPQVQG